MKSEGLLQSTLNQMTMKIQHIKICGMLLKQWWEESITLNSYIRKKKDLKAKARVSLQETEEQNKPKVGRSKEMIMSRNQWKKNEQ